MGDTRSLKDEIEVELSPSDLEELMRPVAGKGGWQALLRKLQRQVNGTTLRLNEKDSAQLVHYILNYGSGGWQDRLAAATHLTVDSTGRTSRKKNG